MRGVRSCSGAMVGGRRASARWRGLAGASLLLACTALTAGAQGVADHLLPAFGTTEERDLAGGEVHRYPLQPGRINDVWLVIVQDGIDITASLVGSEGKAQLSVDSPGGWWGEEWLLIPAQTTVKALEVRAYSPHSAQGRYRLRLESIDPSDPADRRRHAAQRAVTTAGRVNHSNRPDARSQALDHYRTALAVWREIGAEAEEFRTLFLLGMLQRRLHQPKDALALLQQALSGWQRLEDRKGEAQALMEMANTFRRLGDNQRAEKTYLQALALWQGLEDLHGQALTLTYLGLSRVDRATRRALAPTREALALFRRSGDTFQEGVVLNNLGGFHDRLGEPGLALDYYRQALEIHRRIGDERQEAVTWNNVASVHSRNGRLQEALEGFRQSLAVQRRLGDVRRQGQVLNNLGVTWLRLGDVPRAREVLGEALALRRRIGHRLGEAATLHNLGKAHADLSDWDAALEHWTQALAIHRDLGQRRGESANLVALGEASGRLGRWAAARRHLENALAIAEEIGDSWRQGQAWLALGDVLTASGQAQEAAKAIRHSLQLFRATADTLGEGGAGLALSRAERAAGRYAAAYSTAIAALDLLETVRARFDSLPLRTSFLSRRSEAYEFAIDLAMELHGREPSGGWAAAALEISERARARSLLDLLMESGSGLRKGPDAGRAARRQLLLDRLNYMVARRRLLLDRRGPSTETERLAREIRRVEDQLDEIENEIRRQNPRWDALVWPRPLQVGDIQALLDPRTCLLQFSLGERRSFLWLVEAQGIEGFELPRREVLEAAAREAYEGLRTHDLRARRSDADSAARLSEMLLAPAAQRLTGKNLAIVADGALHYLPFAALPHPTAQGEPLLARHELVTLPSASALGMQRRILSGRPLAEKSLAVLADPVFAKTDPRLSTREAGQSPADLDAQDAAHASAASQGQLLERLLWSGWEAERIASRAGDGQALVVLGADADLATVRSGRLEGYRVLHFGTHGIVESEHPELSALVFSLYDEQGRPQEGYLRLPEIYGLDLDAELVVLSGCRTALGPEMRGEGLVGLTRGFFAAGARRLLASLWRVQDRSAAELMDRFYKHLLPQPGGRMRSPAAALRQAQLELMSDPEFRDPYHWAAFALYGDWR